ncbi:MAG: AIPR family protein [Alphaproteobacteria bacterium]|nr:AIPR family protein [Alphaproteobacteria bacterium]
MSIQHKSDLFEFMLKRVKETQKQHLDAEPQAFGRWFAELFFMSPRDIFVSDGSKDGKIDLFFTTDNGKTVLHHVLNTKFTKEFSKIAPPSFYQEIKYFWQAFENRTARAAYLEKAVKPELRPRYKHLFERYDSGAAELMFVTNHRCNDAHFEQVKNIPALKVFHMEDLIQCLVDDIDGAMPRTPPIHLNAIHALLPADKSDTEVATSIVFARLVDFIRYMESDPFDLLFNRNVRVAISVSRSKVNQGIRHTFETSPKEFAFSNNGITMLCEKQHYDPGGKILTLDNPRVVNGSQTLHSIRDVPNPSANARVMVRVIEIEPPRGDALDQKIQQRKEVIGKIAVRSNQQNPIKSWDLASNDDFQLELFRFFRNKGYFYERRDREWRQRSRELRSVGIQYGTSIKWHTQLIASFYWSKQRLGPAVAKNVADLFEGDIYEKIRETSAELAFQLYFLDNVLWESRSRLATDKVYIRSLKTYEYFALFSLVVRALTEVGAKWGDSDLTGQLSGQWTEYNSAHHSNWRKLTKACIDQILLAYKKETRSYSKREGEELSYANYFKNQSYVARILKAKLTTDIKRYARVVLRS